MSSVDGPLDASAILLIWRVGRVQSSVRPVDAVDIGLLALTGSANKVPFCFSGNDAFDISWGVPIPGLTGFAITARRARNLLKLIPQLNFVRPAMPTVPARGLAGKLRRAS